MSVDAYRDLAREGAIVERLTAVCQRRRGDSGICSEEMAGAPFDRSIGPLHNLWYHYPL